MLSSGGSVGRLRLDYLCVLAVASCYRLPPAATSGHPALDVRGCCSQRRVALQKVLQGTAFDLPPLQCFPVMGRDVKEPQGARLL